MKIAVCIKQVPDTEARLRVAKDGRWIEEEDLPFVINEPTSEAALWLVALVVIGSMAILGAVSAAGSLVLARKLRAEKG